MNSLMGASSHVSRLRDSEDYGIAESDSSDHLSELPDSLILLILSLLPMIDVVRTTILSKRWKDLWTTVPCFRFDNTDYSCSEYFICKALSLWRGTKILKFSLSVPVDGHRIYSDLVDFWLRFAIENQVEELYINLTNSRVDYYAPSCLCSCLSIKKLTLVSCKLKDDEKVHWVQLVSLTVEGAETLSENAFNQVFSGAPQLEILNMRVLGFGENLNIKSSSLKVVKIQRCHILVDSPILRIDAPNLETFKFSGMAYTRCWLNVPLLTDVALDFCYQTDTDVESILREIFRSTRHVEKVTLSDCCTQALFEMKKKDMVSPFSDVKFVRLSAKEAHKVLDVLELFPQLRLLVIGCIWDGSRNNHVSNMLELRTNFSSPFLPHLRKVEIAWIVSDPLIYHLIEIVLKNAHVLEDMVFRPMFVEDSESIFEVEEKVMCMPRSSPTAEVLVNEW